MNLRISAPMFDFMDDNDVHKQLPQGAIQTSPYVFDFLMLQTFMSHPDK
jgi:hypothetical protein